MHHIISLTQPSQSDTLATCNHFEWTIAKLHKTATIPLLLLFSTRSGQPFGLQIQESTGTWAPPRLKITWIWFRICVDWSGNWPISVQKQGQRLTSCFDLTNRRNESEAALTNYINQVFVRQRYRLPNLSTRSLSTDIERGKRSSSSMLTFHLCSQRKIRVFSLIFHKTRRLDACAAY